MKKALITGIAGQDGSYLAELLLKEGSQVCGMVRRNSVSENQSARLNHIIGDISIEYGDITDVLSIISLLQKYEPDVIYHLAAQSHVNVSFIKPTYTYQTNAVGTLNLLEAVKLVCPHVKIYNAASSEMFGNSTDKMQTELTPMHPVSPYACSKVAAYNLAKCYRQAYNMYITNGILFNHESVRRGANFVSTKIVKGAIEIAKGKKSTLALGNLEAKRDWGHAKDYVKVMYQLMQLPTPGDYLCATGITHSVREMCEYVFSKLELDYNKYVTQNQRYIRPQELYTLCGDTSKTKEIIDLQFEYTFESMLDEMIDYWIKLYEKN